MDIKNTPWGPVQSKEEIAPGIWHVSTASHGGIVLDDEHAQEMQRRGINNWLKSYKFWEEDLDSVAPLLIFQAEVPEQHSAWARRSYSSYKKYYIDNGLFLEE